MALKKLPCEYPQIGINRAKDMFGDFSDTQKQNLIDAIEKFNKNMEKHDKKKYKKEHPERFNSL